YYYAESASSLAQYLAEDLERAGDTFATNVAVEITPPPGIELLEVYGREPIVGKRGTWTLPLADMAAGDERKIIVRVRVAEGAASDGTLDLAQVALRYDPIEGAAQSGSLVTTANVTADPAEVAAH